MLAVESFNANKNSFLAKRIKGNTDMYKEGLGHSYPRPCLPEAKHMLENRILTVLPLTLFSVDLSQYEIFRAKVCDFLQG